MGNGCYTCGYYPVIRHQEEELYTSDTISRYFKRSLAEFPVLSTGDIGPRGSSSSSDGATLLTPHIAAQLCPYLSLDVRYSPRWKLGYASYVSESGIDAFFGYCEPHGGASIVIIRSACGKTFGGFASGLWLRNGAVSFGDNSSFTFQVDDTSTQAQSRTSWLDGESLRVFSLVARDDNIMYSDVTGFGMGRGKSSGAAWHIASDLVSGKSHRCPTFHSPRFTENVDFVVDCIEVWFFETEWVDVELFDKQRGDTQW